VPDVYIPTAEAQIFRETGSLNISSEARRFRRALLRADLHAHHTTTEVERLISQADAQLSTAVSMIKTAELIRD